MARASLMLALLLLGSYAAAQQPDAQRVQEAQEAICAVLENIFWLLGMILIAMCVLIYPLGLFIIISSKKR